ncbi:MAG: SOS response-associated peptidase family protein [Burkholderiaceae bacterium]
MCTNFVPTRGSILQERFGVQEPEIAFREEAYPGYLSPMIRTRDDAQPQCDAAVFGLIPSWSKDGKNFRFCYNARSETVAEKPSFRNAWRKNQFSIVPADAFYEPCYESGKAVRWSIGMATGEPMGLAAIWEAWKRPPTEAGKPRPGPADLDLLDDDWVISFSLLTVNATGHGVMARFHRPEDEKRSVVILPSKHYAAWLGANNSTARDFLRTVETNQLQAFPAPKKPTKTAVKRPAKPIRKLI